MLALENRFYNEHGRLLARISNGSVEAYGQPAVSIMRPALYDILTEAIHKQEIPIVVSGSCFRIRRYTIVSLRLCIVRHIPFQRILPFCVTILSCHPLSY